MPTKKLTRSLLLPPLLLILLVLVQSARCQHHDDQSKTFEASVGKQSRYSRQVYNITWFWTTPASAVPNSDLLQLRKSAENFTESIKSNEKIGGFTSKRQTNRRASKRRHQKNKANHDKAKQDKHIAGIKSDLMREFASQHGERIKRSRRYADLFDGSGYLLDHMEELRQYQSRAKEHHNRQRRSTDNTKKDSSTIDFFTIEEDLPNFESLTELLDHLNDGPQGDIIQAGINLRFMEEKINRRSKRSYLNDADIDKEPDEDDDTWGREREAEASLERLDAMLKDLATYLDQEHLDANEDAKEDERTNNRHRSIPIMAGFNKQLSGAHKALTQLRDMLVTATASGRMASMHAMPHKTANWKVNAELLRDNVQQLKQIYRQMDEL
ncbi:hypothetical protein BOX15_Mlig017689g3 [Macrostomum lignano]|uniref:Uncharacterized protein n=1 Tax=Macrostomum lignano TaxID=282301 RepID=A0A267GBM5_9PLAT|nr:hypothetical protein BOX15_Mlig017689g3 [Macrostomum lignano]